MNRLHAQVGVLTVSLISALLWVQPIAAQVVPDSTLPQGERSQVTGNPDFQIDGGARRGGNLFHSFQSFSVPTGGSAFFNNAADVQNIFSRVTGGSVSTIDGVIRANGAANLFLLNPNGILFGPNASLNVGGSFVGTTANAIGFPTGEVFSSDATQPLPRQLLTVNPNVLFFNQPTPRPITIQSRFSQLIPQGTDLYSNTPVFAPSNFNATGLHVLPGQNLLLVGGPIQLDSGEVSGSPIPIMVFSSDGIQENIQPNGGWLISPGSHIELGAVGGVGTLGLLTANQDWQLTIPNGVPRANISLSNGSGIYAVGASGSIRLLAQNIDISRSVLLMGIPSDARLPYIQTGDLDLNATAAITINLSRLDSLLSGTGTTGSINLTAGDRISVDSALIFNGLLSSGVGNAGNINITTGSLSTHLVTTNLFMAGWGSIGSVNINAHDIVSLRSTIASSVRSGGVGNGGNINITTASLLFALGTVTSLTDGQGNAGDISINASDTVSFRDISVLSTLTLGPGNAGDVNINAYNALSFDRSNVFNIISVQGSGNNGNTNITTGSLSLTNGATLFSNTSGAGSAGSVNINARDSISIDGAAQGAGFTLPSSIFTQVISGLVGQGGNVNITTGSLALTNGGKIDASTNGQGNAGRVIINARDAVEIRGTVPTSSNFRSGVTTSATLGSVGNGGDIAITTGSLAVSDQGQISTNSQGQGRAGNIQIRANDTVSFEGGDAISTLEPGGLGRGGNIDITARSLSVLNNAQLSASTSGQGDAGDITINADTVDLSSGGQLLTTTFSRGQAGDIIVSTPNLQLAGATSGLFAQTTTAADAGDLTIQPLSSGQSVRVNLQGGAQISASTSNSGRGGRLTITAPESITLTGNGSIISAETSGRGTGGNLTLQAGNLNIQDQAEVTVSSAGRGNAGSLFVNADRIFLNNGGRIRADTSGGGGNINLRSPLILLRNGSNITTNATGADIPGGDIDIDTGFLVAVPNEDSNISANSENFRGGNVSINAIALYGIQPNLVPTPLSDITATGATSALPGSIDVTTATLDPTSGLVTLPADIVDASELIAQACPADAGNSFVITGRGGLLPTPAQELDDAAEWQDRSILTVAQQREHGESVTNSFYVSPSSNPSILEANGWQTTPVGEVILVAHSTNPRRQPLSNNLITCQGEQ